MHASVIHAASTADHEKVVVWVSISLHACGSVPIVMVLRLAALQAAGTLKVIPSIALRIPTAHDFRVISAHT